MKYNNAFHNLGMQENEENDPMKIEHTNWI